MLAQFNVIFVLIGNRKFTILMQFFKGCINKLCFFFYPMFNITQICYEGIIPFTPEKTQSYPKPWPDGPIMHPTITFKHWHTFGQSLKSLLPLEMTSSMYQEVEESVLHFCLSQLCCLYSCKYIVQVLFQIQEQHCQKWAAFICMP